MPSPRTVRLDALEARLTGPKRIALFGHRNVGKTTLLAMFYRQAASGQVPGVRLAAADAQCAEYLAEKIAQIESGQPMSGTLAETELNLRLYHGPARFELILRDYQGEHVTLGSSEPIQEFFAGCDAVFFCLDPEGSADPVERRRRQQEVESLLERYIERSEDLSIDRPVALLLTKFDRVLSGLGERSGDLKNDSTDADQAAELEPRPSLAGPFVERLVEHQYGMTRHALRQHAPDGAIFAVSSYGPGSTGNRPPATLHPMGLEGPLGWLAEQLEARDRAQMEWLWELAPADFPRLQRCVAAYERRYPRSNRSFEFRRASTNSDAGVNGGVPANLSSSPRSYSLSWPATTSGGSTVRRRSSGNPKTPRPLWRASGPACWPNTLHCHFSGPCWHDRLDSRGTNGP